ncbi:MAG TPA: nuclear transport factor 2 family protein [Sphingobium sp.]|uniref:nuclear transport factor 2 family protein n=1 Tax=Sphingobium sp. TaxID=1912891 RepID=UPI002ED00BF7
MFVSEIERLAAVDAIRTVKARYWRGVDLSDGDLVRSILHEDCELDYRGCCTDPTSGQDFFPAMNVVLRGSASWTSDAFRKARIVSVHQGQGDDIEILDETHATGIWSFTDRFFYPAGAPYRRLVGYGFYHDSYEKTAGAWKLKTTRIERLRVEAE